MERAVLGISLLLISYGFSSLCTIYGLNGYHTWYNRRHHDAVWDPVSWYEWQFWLEVIISIVLTLPAFQFVI